MKLILVRHGQSHSADVDPTKSLSPEGEAAVRKVGERMKGRVEVTRIIHSDKSRAKQTAEILGSIMNPTAPVEEHANLSPNDPVEPILNEIVEEKDCLMIVSHLPFLPNLMEKLGSPTIEFQPATAVCLDEGRNLEWIELPQ